MSMSKLLLNILPPFSSEIWIDCDSYFPEGTAESASSNVKTYLEEQLKNYLASLEITDVDISKVLTVSSFAYEGDKYHLRIIATLSDNYKIAFAGIRPGSPLGLASARVVPVPPTPPGPGGGNFIILHPGRLVLNIAAIQQIFEFAKIQILRTY